MWRIIYPGDVMRWIIDVKPFIQRACTFHDLNINDLNISKISFTTEADAVVTSPSIMCNLHRLRLSYETSSGGSGGGGGGTGPPKLRSPTLFVWNGSEYIKEATLHLHGGSDVTIWHTIEQLLVPEDDHYLLSLRELNNSISHIDYVKLYAMDVNGKMYEGHLYQAIHNKFGNIKRLLLSDDDNRAYLGPSQSIDLKFSVPEIENIIHLMFVIQGYEP